MVDQSFIVVHERTKDFFEDKVGVMMLSAVSCLMRHDLNRIQDYLEVTVPSYVLTGFCYHFQITRGVCEILCREIVNTGKIPAGNTRMS